MTRALQTIPQEPEQDISAEIYLTGYFLLPFGSVLLLPQRDGDLVRRVVQCYRRSRVVRPHLRARAARHAIAVLIDAVAAMA